MILTALSYAVMSLLINGLFTQALCLPRLSKMPQRGALFNSEGQRNVEKIAKEAGCHRASPSNIM